MLFLELVHFTQVFPHPNLRLEVLLTEQEEERQPITRRNRRQKPYRVLGRSLREIVESVEIVSVDDLVRMLPPKLHEPFSTADLASELGIPRWLAQKMAYCLRQTGGLEISGKQGNSLLYAIAPPHRRVA